jgi:hypothetical protein
VRGGIAISSAYGIISGGVIASRACAVRSWSSCGQGKFAGAVGTTS